MCSRRLDHIEFMILDGERLDVFNAPIARRKLGLDPMLVYLGNSAQLDSFGRLRTSEPTYVFDAQLTYNLQPLLYEPITSGAGATITHDATNRMALMTFAATPSGSAFMQTYEYFRYQPGRSQAIYVTFNFKEAKANVLKFAGYSDGVNGIEFQLNGDIPQMVIYSGTGNGNQTVVQDDWNIDKLDGKGESRLTLDITKTQIFFIDLQALYVGRVRVGFNIDGASVVVHEFDHANEAANPYIQDANLPVRCGMTCSASATTTMNMICASVISESGSPNSLGYGFTVEGAVSAGSGTRTHILSLRHKTTFNGIVNRGKFILESLDITGGLNSVYWEICLGQAISGTTTFNDVNATYSFMEYNTAGTISGNPTIVIESGYVGSSNASKGSVIKDLQIRYPICLSRAGAVRSLGTVSVLVSGIGGASSTRVALNWREIR